MLCPIVNNTNPNKPLSKRGDKIKIQIKAIKPDKKART